MVSSEQGVSDTLALRKAIYGGGDPTRADLENLLSRAASSGANREFSALLAEVATDVLVRQVDPEGYVTDPDAAWLMAQMRGGGGLASCAEFELLKAVISHAVSVPPALTAFAVREIEKTILTGRRVALGGIDHEPGIVTAEDVETLRAFVFAPTRASSLHVDRGTAEALFDIAHATATARNAPEFADFFARAVGNHVMGIAFLAAPDRAVVLSHEAERDRPSGFGAFFAAMRGGASRSGLVTAIESVDDGVEEAIAAINAETDRQISRAEHVDAGEAKWILGHLTRGGELTPAEKRLLAFLRDEATSAPPELAALYEQAA